MKKIGILVAMSLLFVFGAIHQGNAQNFFKTEPGMCKMLGDTTIGTAAVVTFLPGQKTKPHTHAAEFVYALTDGELTVHYTDGGVQKFELKEGDSFIAPPEKQHWTENTGKKTLKFVLLEFNEHPYMMEKTMKH